MYHYCCVSRIGADDPSEAKLQLRHFTDSQKQTLKPLQQSFTSKQHRKGHLAELDQSFERSSCWKTCLAQKHYVVDAFSRHREFWHSCFNLRLNVFGVFSCPLSCVRLALLNFAKHVRHATKTAGAPAFIVVVAKLRV